MNELDTRAERFLESIRAEGEAACAAIHEETEREISSQLDATRKAENARVERTLHFETERARTRANRDLSAARMAAAPRWLTSARRLPTRPLPRHAASWPPLPPATNTPPGCKTRLPRWRKPWARMRISPPARRICRCCKTSSCPSARRLPPMKALNSAV